MTRVLDKAILKVGKPVIRCDHGPEISGRHFLGWAIEQKTDMVHIRPACRRRMPTICRELGSITIGG